MLRQKLGVPLLITMFAAAVSAQVTLSHNTDNVTIVPGSVACFNQVGGFTTDNSYWRSYTLANFGVATPMDLGAVRVGMEEAADPTGSQSLRVRIYTDPTPANPAPAGGLTLLTDQVFTIVNTAGAPRVETLNLNPTVPLLSTDTVVVEIFSPTGINGPTTFFIGANNLGQSAPSYLSASSCGIAEPTDTAVVAPGSNQHQIIDIVLYPAGTALQYPGTAEDLVMHSAVNAGPFLTGLLNDVRSVNALDFLTLRCSSLGGFFVHSPLILAGQLFATGSPPPSPFPGINVSPFGAFALVGAGSSPLGFVLLGPGNYDVSVQVPGVLGGIGASVILQYLCLNQTAANFIFGSTDGHEFQIN